MPFCNLNWDIMRSGRAPRAKVRARWHVLRAAVVVTLLAPPGTASGTDGVDARKESAPPVADGTAPLAINAVDPHKEEPQPRAASDDWEAVYRERLDWWSLQPVVETEPPAVTNDPWVRTDVDRFILAALEQQGLQPVPEADRRVLARRLSFALTGLPPGPEMVERFAGDSSPQAYEDFVATLLDSPHFGERWARHWMDVVHYADSHGYEWDVPAKNAWRYRDYLIRAYNADIPFRQLVLEQIAGDLIEPRVDAETGLIESLIGPMALRLGEWRHGDNAAAEGVTQEAVAKMIDTIGKGFLGTTLACAQCHDHKLDAVEQRDYYALAGVLMSTRFSARTLDAVDPNVAVIERLGGIKQKLRAELARVWLGAADDVVKKFQAIPASEKDTTPFPESLAGFWQRSLKSPVTAESFTTERQRRMEANQDRLTLLADFRSEQGAAGWRWEGFGMRHGLVSDGAIVVADEGDTALMQILPAGRFSHTWSQRLAGSLQSPLFDTTQPSTISLELAAGKFATQAFIVDRALHSERMEFLNQRSLGWQTLTAGNFDTLEGSVDTGQRLVYFELATKSLNNYFPPRIRYRGLKKADEVDPRSWFGVTRIFRHPAGQPPLDELARFIPLFEKPPQPEEWAGRLATLLLAAIERWSDGTCDSEDVRLLNDALRLKLLPNELACSPETARLVAEYRDVEKQLQPDRTGGSVVDWNEGVNARIGVRGSYTEFGAEVERGANRFLGGPSRRPTPSSSGRLELARRIADEQNPLTARVYVNRVWHYLFGEGLVRTPDDFGHLGEKPTHPELLDYLAARFMREGWSTKKLVTLLVTSATWRQQSEADGGAWDVDPDNRLWHHVPMRRLEAEAIRDAMLAVSGRMDTTLFGPPVDPHRPAEDESKRLLSGPVDGRGRRSLYTKMTLMEPPRFLALFNQPIPKVTVGRRDVTNVPDQALALLNDPFVIEMATHWSERLVADGAKSPGERSERMFAAAVARRPNAEETARLVELVRRSAELRGAPAGALLECQPAWQDAAHAVFNLKEFIHVP